MSDNITYTSFIVVDGVGPLVDALGAGQRIPGRGSLEHFTVSISGKNDLDITKFNDLATKTQTSALESGDPFGGGNVPLCTRAAVGTVMRIGEEKVLPQSATGIGSFSEDKEHVLRGAVYVTPNQDEVTIVIHPYQYTGAGHARAVAQINPSTGAFVDVTVAGVSKENQVGKNYKPLVDFVQKAAQPTP